MAFFILYLESYISRLNEILRHDLTLSVSEPDNAAAQIGAGTAFGVNGGQHTRAAELSTYFCVLTIRKHLLKIRFERSGRGQEPSRGHKFSILENFLSIRDFTSQTLASFLSDLVGACLPQTLLRTDEEELCQFDTIPPTIERNRALPMGERPVSLVIYGPFRVRSQGAPCFCFEPSPAF